VVSTPPLFLLRLKLRLKRRPRLHHSLLRRHLPALRTLEIPTVIRTATLPLIITAAILRVDQEGTTTILRIIVEGHLAKDHPVAHLTQQTDVLLLIQECPQVLVATLQIQAMVDTHPHHTVDPKAGPIPEVGATHQARIRHRDQDGLRIRVMGHRLPMADHLHLTAMRHPLEQTTDRVIMAARGRVSHHLQVVQVDLHRPQLHQVVHLRLRQQQVVVVHPTLPLVVHLPTKICMDSSRHIMISISLNLPVEHQVSNQADHLAHQGRRDLFNRHLYRILKRNPQGHQALHLRFQHQEQDRQRQLRRSLHRVLLPLEAVPHLQGLQELGLLYLLACWDPDHLVPLTIQELRHRIMAPVVHQVPLQVGLQGGHQLRKAIQSGQRDLNHSLHRGRLAHRVVDLPVLIPILDRGLQCIQGAPATGKTDIHHKVGDIPWVIADLGDLKELHQGCHQERSPLNGQADPLVPQHREKDPTILMQEVQACNGEAE